MASPWRTKRSKRGKLLQLIEFVAAYTAFRLAQVFPLTAGHAMCRALGTALYYLVPKRRKIALDNLRHVYGRAKNEREIKTLAQQSCYSFVASLFETVKLVCYLSDKEHAGRIRAAQEGLEPLFQKAKHIHDRTGGCVFVAPHLGNWEFLPYVASSVGIPLVVVVRPLDNGYLENLLYRHRAVSGQLVIPKTNSMYFLQTALRQGKSVALLPDQSTMKAITVDYMGRQATTTPIPAWLALLYNRPIVVVACCRVSTRFRYDGFVSDPIWPHPERSEKEEIFRLTQAMNREMAAIIRRYPDQYFWMHDRWKVYTTKGMLSL
jgi:KDO2-lipid IV(A) lauroyltransferase